MGMVVQLGDSNLQLVCIPYIILIAKGVVIGLDIIVGKQIPKTFCRAQIGTCNQFNMDFIFPALRYFRIWSGKF